MDAEAAEGWRGFRERKEDGLGSAARRFLRVFAGDSLGLHRRFIRGVPGPQGSPNYDGSQGPLGPQRGSEMD